MTSIVLAALLLQTPAADTWGQVTAIPAGTALRVTLDAGRLEGTLVGATYQGISIRLSRGEQTFERSRIRRIERRQSNGSRAKHVGLGFLAGIGAGLVLQRATCSGNNCMAEAAFAYTVPFELIGLAAGAAIPTARWETIYR